MARVLPLLCVVLTACTGHAVPRQSGASAETVVWTRVTTLAELDAALRAVSEPRPIVIDFHAAWCMPCIELEQATFVDPTVTAEMRRFTAIQIDVTDDTASELRQLFTAETLPNVQVYAADSALGQRITAWRPGSALPRPAEQVTSFVSPAELAPMLAKVR
jgi:thiol:disulfide interchange protein DsbD